MYASINTSMQWIFELKYSEFTNLGQQYLLYLINHTTSLNNGKFKVIKQFLEEYFSRPNRNIIRRKIMIF